MINPYCQITSLTGELKTHREILSRLRGALQQRTARARSSLMVVFPTISLLEFIQDELLGEAAGACAHHGYGGIRFLLFEGFMNEVGAEFGLNIRKPSALLRDLLIARACRELEEAELLTYLKQIPFNAAFRAAILGGIAEWKRSGLTPDLFREWAADHGLKERELALLYQKYQELLVEYGFSEEDLVLDAIENLFLETARRGMEDTSPSKVILYGFQDLTPLQNDFIRALGPCYQFEAIVDPTPVPLFREFTAKSFAEKTKGTAAGYPGKTGESWAGEPCGVSCAPQDDSCARTALQILQQKFWIEKPSALPLAPADESLQILRAAGKLRETQAIARTVQQWLRSGADRSLEDVLIITPEPQDFLKRARPVFQEYQLALDFAAEPVRESATVNLVTQSLAVIMGDWQWRDVISFLRCAYWGELVQEADRLACFLGERYGAIAGRKRWLTLVEEVGLAERFQEIGLHLESFKAAINFLAEIPERATLYTFLLTTRNYLQNALTESIKVRLRQGSIFEPDLESRRFHSFRAAQLLITTIGELVEQPWLARELARELPIEDFWLFYEENLLPLELEAAPTKRATVRVIHPREARGLRSQLVFITGLEQGHCPRIYVNDWKIGPKARWELKTLGIELETGEQYQIQEKLAFYWALQTASQQLFLVYQEQDENGQPLNRSIFVEEICEWFPAVCERATCYSLSPILPASLADCYSAREIQGRFASDLMIPLPTEETAPLPELTANERLMCLELLQQSPYRRLALHINDWTERDFGATASLLKHPESLRFLSRHLGPETVFPVTILEDYLHCPLRFYLKHLLKIKPASRPELRPGGLDLGIIYHQVLSDFGELHRQQSLHFKQYDTYQGELRDLFEHSFREWRDKAATDLEYLFLDVQGERIWVTLQNWLKAELEWAVQTGGEFHFNLLEFAFGFPKGDFDPASLIKPFLLNDGEEAIRIAGKIDRIDTDAKGRFIIYDYKLGAGPSGRDLLELKQLQISVYLLALEQLQFDPGKGVGGAYLGLANPSRWNGGVWRSSQLTPDREIQTVLADEAWNQWLQDVRANVTALVHAIRAGQFAKVADACLSYCEYRESCRRGDWEVNGDEMASESGAE